jgi:hypothetical protein
MIESTCHEGMLAMYAEGWGGQVWFDGLVVTIQRKGFVARATVGKGEKRIPISSIVAVQWKPAGVVNGFIQFTIAGGNEARSRFGRQSMDDQIRRVGASGPVAESLLVLVRIDGFGEAVLAEELHISRASPISTPPRPHTRSRRSSA